MKKSILLSLTCIGCIIFSVSCSTAENVDINAFSIELDAAYIDDSRNFSIKPPLDWTLHVKNDDVVFKPDIAELNARNAKAQIVIQYIKLDEILTPEQFRDIVESDIKNSKRVDDYEILGYGGTPSNAYCNILVVYDSPIGDSIHYLKNILAGAGYFRIAGSSLKKSWKNAAPLLKTSVESFKIIE
ncbi:MAG: hypothetical protein K8S87_02345 [Planctomycetes bacterium]|nr:hypothetical protein [Planctomycetota bacterium]